MNFDILLRCAQEFAEEDPADDHFLLKIYDPWGSEGALKPEYESIFDTLELALSMALKYFQQFAKYEEREFYVEIQGPNFNYHGGPMESYDWRPLLIKMRKALESRVSVEIKDLTGRYLDGKMFDTRDEALVWLDQQTEKIPGSQEWKAEITRPRLTERGEVEVEREEIEGPKAEGNPEV